MVVLNPEDGAPAATEPAEVGQAGDEGSLSAPPEPKAESAPPTVEEREIVVAAAKVGAMTAAVGEAEAGTAIAGEAEAGTTVVGEARPKVLPSKRKLRPDQRVQERLQRLLPWPVPRSSTMEDGAMAESLLRELWLPEIHTKLVQRSLSELLDTTYVSILQTTNGVLALRDGICQTNDSLVCSQERAGKFKDQGKKMAEDFGRKLEEAWAREADMEDKLRAVKAERDAWQARFKEAESQTGVERGRVFAVETIARFASTRQQLAEKRADELALQLDATEHRVDAILAEKVATDERAGEAELAATKAERGRARVMAQAWDAGARAKEAKKAAGRIEEWA